MSGSDTGQVTAKPSCLGLDATSRDSTLKLKVFRLLSGALQTTHCATNGYSTRHRRYPRCAAYPEGFARRSRLITRYTPVNRYWVKCDEMSGRCPLLENHLSSARKRTSNRSNRKPASDGIHADGLGLGRVRDQAGLSRIIVVRSILYFILADMTHRLEDISCMDEPQRQVKRPT